MVLSGIAGYKRAAPTEMSGWLGGPPHFAQYLCSLEILAALLSLVRLEVDRARGADKNVRAPFAFLQTVGYCELRMCLAKSVALY